ncbi:MAG: cytochrome P450 [Sandaracinaceae bacterium]
MSAAASVLNGMMGLGERAARRRRAAGRLPPAIPLPETVQLTGFLLRQFDSLEAFRGRLGTPFMMSFPGGVPIAVYDDPDAIKEIFTGSSDAFHAGQANEPLRPVVGGHSLLLLDKDRHLRERKLLLPPFHGARMVGYGETMREITEQELLRWPIGEVFRLLPRTQAITLDVILRTVFGVEGARMDALRTALGGLIDAFSQPGLLAPPFQRTWWPPWARFLRTREAADRLLYRVIEERRGDHERGDGAKKDDILSMLLEARHEDGAPMSDLQLRDELMTLLAAGHETTATALAWTMHHLSENPRVQRRVHAELDDALEGGRVDPGRASELVYLDAVIKEAMRMAPVIGGVGRVLSAPATIGGYALPVGTMAAASIYLTHHNARVHPDPHVYRPERFLERKIGPYEFLPFGGGVRRCIGMAFALYEMKVVLSTILARHRVRRAKGARIEPRRRSVTSAPSGDMPIVIERR